MSAAGPSPEPGPDPGGSRPAPDPVPSRIEYSVFYFVQFLGIGISAPYEIVFLKRMGFSGVAIGTVSAGQKLMAMAGNWFWGLMSDTRLGTRKSMLILIFFTAALMPFFTVVKPHYLIAALVLTVIFFSGSMVPLADAGIIGHLACHRDLYGTVRAFGTIGFIVAAWAMGRIVQANNIFWMFWCYSAVTALLFFCAIVVPFSKPPERNHNGGKPGGLAGIQWRRIAPVLIVIFLMNLAAKPGNVFLSLFIDSMGGEKTDYIKGLAWALGPIPEVPFFFLSHYLIKHLGIKRILVFGLGLYVVRWGLIAWAPSPAAVLWVQPLHGICFGATYLAAVRAADMMSGQSAGASAQSLVQSIGVSAPTILGQFAAGWIYDLIDVRAIYWAATAVTAVALFVAILFVNLDEPSRMEI